MVFDNMTEMKNYYKNRMDQTMKITYLTGASPSPLAEKEYAVLRALDTDENNMPYIIFMVNNYFMPKYGMRTK